MIAPEELETTPEGFGWCLECGRKQEAPETRLFFTQCWDCGELAVMRAEVIKQVIKLLEQTEE
jgi:predicted RNA-binding Zn-ribbon protein involved in translation (DUF1610 family)